MLVVNIELVVPCIELNQPCKTVLSSNKSAQSAPYMQLVIVNLIYEEDSLERPLEYLVNIINNLCRNPSQSDAQFASILYAHVILLRLQYICLEREDGVRISGNVSRTGHRTGRVIGQ